MNAITKAFLHRCKAAGYTRVAISADRVTCWPETAYIDRWPALWHILAEMNIHGCSGHGHSHQYDTSCGLIPGTYQLTEVMIPVLEEVAA
jgi:hypothetical protein